MEGSEFVTDTEWGIYINEGYKELHGLLATLSEDYYVADPVEFTLTSSAAGKKAIAADFFKLLGVDKSLGGGRWQELNPFMFRERNRKGGIETSRTTMLKYRLLGANLHFVPAELATGDFRYWYIPAAPDLDDDADEVDGVNGWEEYIVVDAAIKALAKEESSTTDLENRKGWLRKQIEDQARDRNEGDCERIQDVRGGYDCDHDEDW